MFLKNKSKTKKRKKNLPTRFVPRAVQELVYKERNARNVPKRKEERKIKKKGTLVTFPESKSKQK